MRTAIFLVAISIQDATNVFGATPIVPEALFILTVLFVLFAAMDIIEFINRIH